LRGRPADVRHPPRGGSCSRRRSARPEAGARSSATQLRPWPSTYLPAQQRAPTRAMTRGGLSLPCGTISSRANVAQAGAKRRRVLEGRTARMRAVPSVGAIEEVTPSMAWPLVAFAFPLTFRGYAARSRLIIRAGSDARSPSLGHGEEVSPRRHVRPSGPPTADRQYRSHSDISKGHQSDRHFFPELQYLRVWVKRRLR
jgi:hypothetical protein